MDGTMLAVVRIRGSVNVPSEVKDTLKMLRLNRVNHCVLIPKDPNYEGMLLKAQSFVTWGEISQGTLERLVAKRGRKTGDERLSDREAKEISGKIIKHKSTKDSGIKPVFRLSPPTKGYRSIRMAYPRGDLGKRGEAINRLIKRMI